MPRNSGSRSAEPAEARSACGPRISGAARGGKARGTEGFGRSRHSSDIAGVLYARENHDQRNISADEIVEARLARADERGDALRVLGGGDAGEETIGGAQNSSAGETRARQSCEMLFSGGTDKARIETQAAANGFANQMRAFDADEIGLR